MAEEHPTPEGPRFRIGLIGRFWVRRDDQPLADSALGSRKERTLLKLLLLNRGRALSTERVVEVLWGSSPRLRPSKACHRW